MKSQKAECKRTIWIGICFFKLLRLVSVVWFHVTPFSPPSQDTVECFGMEVAPAKGSSSVISDCKKKLANSTKNLILWCKKIINFLNVNDLVVKIK